MTASSVLPDVGPGVVLRELTVTSWDGTPIRSVLITPDGPPRPRPAVVLGHDLGGDATAERYLDLAAEYAREQGFTVATLDGPFHGARRSPVLAALDAGGPPDPAEFAKVRAEMGRPGHSEHMAADWSALVDLLTGQPEVDAGRIGFEAVSMSSLYGVAFVARELRVRAAAFHVVGLRRGADAGAAGPELGGDIFAERIAAIGERPVMVLAQSEDELFTRESSLAFYDTLTGTDKELVFLPGAHRTPPAGPPAGRRQSASFLARHLGSGR